MKKKVLLDYKEPEKESPKEEDKLEDVKND